MESAISRFYRTSGAGEGRQRRSHSCGHVRQIRAFVLDVRIVGKVFPQSAVRLRHETNIDAVLKGLRRRWGRREVIVCLDDGGRDHTRWTARPAWIERYSVAWIEHCVESLRHC